MLSIIQIKLHIYVCYSSCFRCFITVHVFCKIFKKYSQNAHGIRLVGVLVGFPVICKFHWFWRSNQYLFRNRRVKMIACSLKKSVTLFGKWKYVDIANSVYAVYWINKSLVEIKKSFINIRKSYVNIIMLHVDINYLVRKRQKYVTIEIVFCIQ